MASTGSLLRELREQRGVSLEELARSTRISPRFLAALEVDDVAALPAGPFAQGFIRAYCEALGASPEEALAQHRLTRGIPAGSAEPRARVRAVPARSRAPLLVSFVLLLGLGIALAAVTLVLKPKGDDAFSRSARARDHAANPAPYTAETMAPPRLNARPPVTVGPGPAAETVPPPRRVPDPAGSIPTTVSRRATVSASQPPTVAKGKSYRLVARASQATRIRVRLDGRRTVEETIPAGAVREWTSSRPFELRIVNAGGVTLELNGRVLPPLGARGTTVHRLVLPSEPR